VFQVNAVVKMRNAFRMAAGVAVEARPLRSL